MLGTPTRPSRKPSREAHDVPNHVRRNPEGQAHPQEPAPSNALRAGHPALGPELRPRPYSDADLAWLNENPVTDEDRHYERLAFEAMATGLLERGLCF